MHVPPMPASWLQQKKHVFNLCSAGLFVDMHAGMSAGMCFDTFLQSFPPPLPSICPCVHVCAQASVRVCVRARPCVRLCMRHASGWLDRRLTRRAISRKKTDLFSRATSIRAPVCTFTRVVCVFLAYAWSEPQNKAPSLFPSAMPHHPTRATLCQTTP